MNLQEAYSLIEQTKKTYNLIAPHFHQTRQKPWPELESLKDLFFQGQSVLDFGCGNGRFYSLIKDKNINYYGVDISEKLINLAQKQVPQGKFKIVNSDLKLSYQDNFFDNLVCIATLHHIPSEKLRRKGVLEFKRVLKNNGTLILTVWDFYHGNNTKYLNLVSQNKKLEKGDLFIPWKDNSGKTLAQRYFHAFTIEELKTLISNTGFKIQESKLISHNNKKKYFNILLIAKKD
jgi:ubiquinone/menaquinone biosynthesis C-methylase UbiE